MKHFYPLLLVAVLFTRPIFAQTTDPVQAKLELIFANLDKSQVPTGRLVEDFLRGSSPLEEIN